MINLQNKMAVKVTKKVKYATALYHKINATRSTFIWKFHAFFKKCTPFGLCRPTIGHAWQIIVLLLLSNLEALEPLVMPSLCLGHNGIRLLGL